MDHGAAPARQRSAGWTAGIDSLAAMADDLAGHFALEPLLERILRHCMDLLGCESGSICTVDELTGTYRKEVDLGVGCHSGQTFPLDEGMTGEVVRAGGPVVFDSYAQVRGGHIAVADRAALHAVIGVPIRWNGGIIGSCVVFSQDPARRFTPDDAALLELFATHAAIAITNARLYAQATARAGEAAGMAERERLIRDVHDTVARGLAAVLLQLDNADRAAAGKDDPRVAIAAARREARTALTEMNRAVLGLGPGLLDDRSLSDAISLELGWIESTAALHTQLVVVGEVVALAPETARQVLRIVQESLTNVLEHARATRVRVGLVHASQTITVLIEDDGRGFDVAGVTGPGARPGRGLGLQGLLARAVHLGGSLQIESTPQWGTRVRAELPIAGVHHGRGSASRWRVLLVHENAVVRAGLVRMLALVEPDVQVVGEIGEACEAVDAYQLLHPDVVLVHLDQPHIDGAQLTAHLRAADPTAAVVIFIDSITDDRIRGAARIGAVGFVEHDASADALVRAIVAAARGDCMISAEVMSHFTASVVDAGSVDALTAREREVRALVEQGLPDKQIASVLAISAKTVEKHVGAILRKTGAANRTVLAGQSVPHR